jgi:hypothetical protein
MPDELSYRVVWSQQAIASAKELANKARASGREKELARVIRTLDARLCQDPLAAGEICRSRGVVEEHLAIHEFLAINFAVDKERKLVLVRGCCALSGHGL